MAPRSKLKIALAAEKGLTDKKVKQIKDKKKHKAVIKEKRKKGLLPEHDDDSEEEEQEWEDEDDSDEGEDGDGLLDVEAEETDDDDEDDESEREQASTAALLNESDTDSESEVDMEEKIERKPKSILKKTENRRKQRLAAANEDDEEEDEDEEAEEEDEDSDIALSDLEDLPEEEREDLLVKTKLSINNQPALLAAVRRISIPRGPGTPFAAHQTVVSAEPTGPKIEDISDDLQREVQLYAQALDAARRARALLRAEGLPFSRPGDYFAEMVKDDGHMDKVKARLVEEAAAKKASAEARKQRDLRKFGKQVQVAKLQERHREKRETLEKIKALKKKRAENGSGGLDTTEADLFDVAVDNELNKPGKRGRGDDRDDRRGAPNPKRARKDAKFGFGGKKRHAKSGTAESSGDVSGFSARAMKGKAGGPPKKKIAKTARLGKSKRKAVAGKR